jgi:uncharacterized protein YacL
MLILLLRLFFVLLAVIIGSTSGNYFYRPLFDEAMPPWFGGAMGFGVAITLIAAEHAFRKHFTRSLVALLIGLGAGLLLSALLLTVVHQAIQDEEVYRNLDLPLALLTTYLVIITVLHGADRFRVIVPFIEFRSEAGNSGNMGSLLLDLQSLADGRLVGLVKSGLLPQRLLVHRRVLMQAEAFASSDDAAEKAKGKRMLDGMAELRSIGTLDIDDTEIPNAASLADILVRLARLEGARLVVSDQETSRRASAEGVQVVDLNALATVLSPHVRPGDILSVKIDKAGEAKHQGVGFLDDGSMVIVNNAADGIGSTVRCTVLRLHNTANGRMVFADRVT